MRRDLAQDLGAQGLAAGAEDLPRHLVPLLVDLGLLIDLAADQTRVVPEQRDHGVGLVHKHPGVVVDVQHALRLEVRRRPLGVVLAPLQALLGAGVALVDGLAHGILHARQHGVGEALAQVRHLVGGHAVDGDPERDGEGGAVLQDLELVDQRGPELVGRHLRVHLGAQPEHADLLAVHEPPRAA